MSTTNMINSQAMLDGLKRQMNEDMMRAAEPVILEAVATAEKEMRRKLAQTFVALIDSSFSMERLGTDLHIIVKMDKS